MLKCLVSNCDVVIAPKTRKVTPQQKGALVRHLSGKRSSWAGRRGHGLSDLKKIREWVELSVKKSKD